MYLHARAKFSPDRSSGFEAFPDLLKEPFPAQIYPHMHAKFGHDRSSRLAADSWHARTHTRNIILYYIDRYLIIDPTSHIPIMLIYYYFIYLNIYRECVRANSCSVLCDQMFSRKFESLPLQQTKLPYLI